MDSASYKKCSFRQAEERSAVHRPPAIPSLLMLTKKLLDKHEDNWNKVRSRK